MIPCLGDLAWALRSSGKFTGTSIAPAMDRLFYQKFRYDSLVTMKRASSPKYDRRRAGTWLKGLRETAGLTPLELANRLGFKYYALVSQVEIGFARLPIEKIEPWAKEVGVDPAWFAWRLL